MKVLVFGKSGSGKTTYVTNLISKLNRLIIIDYKDEYKGVICNSSIDAIKHIIENPKQYRCVIRLTDNDPGMFKRLNELNNYTLVIEELWNYCSPYYIDPDLFKIIAYGRHKKINFIGISQRPAHIHRLVTSQANVIVSFKQYEPRDITYLGYFGFKHLTKLKQYESEIVIL